MIFYMFVHLLVFLLVLFLNIIIINHLSQFIYNWKLFLFFGIKYHSFFFWNQISLFFFGRLFSDFVKIFNILNKRQMESIITRSYDIIQIIYFIIYNFNWNCFTLIFGIWYHPFHYSSKKKKKSIICISNLTLKNLLVDFILFNISTKWFLRFTIFNECIEWIKYFSFFLKNWL